MSDQHDPKYELHSIFKDVSWLHKYPDFAYSALQGAEYHYKVMTGIFDRSFRTTNPKTKAVVVPGNEKFQSEYMQLTWHLRGFFWEFTALFDLVLRWSNERYGLGKSSGSQLRWTDLRKCPSTNGKEAEWDKTRASVNRVWQSPWHFEVRAYRNFAHQIFPQYELILESHLKHMEDKEPDLEALRFNLLPVRDGQGKFDLFAQLKLYLDNTTQFGTDVFGKLKDNEQS